MKNPGSTTLTQAGVLLKQAASLFQQGDLARAETLAKQILATAPNHADAAHLLGVIAGRRGNHKLAARLIARAIKTAPRQPTYHFNLGFALHSSGRLREAVAAYQQATRFRPRYAEAHFKRGDVLKELRRMEEALAAYRQAIRLKPDLAEAHNNRANVLRMLGRLWEALAAGKRALSLNPNTANRAVVYKNLGNILVDLGQLEEAESSYRRALELKPDYAHAHSNLLFMLGARARLAPEELLGEQRRWDRVQGRRGRENLLPPRKREAPPHHRLRVGYVSPDLHRHVVSYFLEPILAAHDRARVEVFCYASHPEPLSDATTERLRQYAEHWRFVHRKGDEQLARLIHEDGIDVLVDLAGHTANSRLLAFTYRPAPVQATYLGYFAGTGLETMDYWISDEVLHPTDTPEQATERIYRLPRCWVCYKPPAEAPAVSPCPTTDDQVVFGSFGKLSKLTMEAIETWSQLLHELPGSQLLLMAKPLVEKKTCQQLLDQFASWGVDPKRLLLQKGATLKEYLAAYARVDIVLDTFPRTGGTTTAEALWMGVPVVTLAGQYYVERISASKLVAVGLEDLITHNRNDYISTALSLAHNPARRAGLRKNLRDMMAQSPLCNTESLVQALEDAYLSMWDRFLENANKDTGLNSGE